MHVLVTGATGRVGANVVAQLSSHGAMVRALVLPHDANKKKLHEMTNVEIVEGDLHSQNDLNGVCKGITHVVHLGAQLVRGSTPVDQYWDANAFGTLRLLQAIVHSDARVERFLLASTDSTYRPGDPPAIPIFEDALQEPCTYYGTGKLLSEVILKNVAKQFDISFSIIRFSTVVSPEEAGNMFRLRSLRNLLSWQRHGKDSNIWQLFVNQPDLLGILNRAVEGAEPETAVGFVGPGGEAWTLHMVDVRDATEGVLRVLQHPNAVGRAFNIAAAAPTSYVEGAAVVSDLFSVPNLTIELPLTWRLELSVDASRELLDFEARYDFRSTVLDGSSRVATNYIPACANSGVAAIL